MKRKAELLHMSPVLVELILVTLFLALSCSVILQLIAGAWELSDRSTKQSEALLLVEDMIERTKADPEGSHAFDASGMRQLAEENGAYTLTGSVCKKESAGGAVYEITVRAESGGKALVALTTNRYVPAGEAGE